MPYAKVLTRGILPLLLASGAYYLIAAPDLKSLYDAHDWFALRDALTSSPDQALYAGAVAAAFDQTKQAEEKLRSVIDDGSDSDAAADASSWLSYMYLRHGQYRKAAAEMDPASPLAGILAGMPDQSTSSFSQSSVAGRIYRNKLYVPIRIGEKSAELFLDSDANFSFLSESAARAFGLSIRGSDVGTVHGASGANASVRLAVADRLTIGNVEIHNAAFMVLSDSEEVFQHLSVPQQGALGLQVLLALKAIRFSNRGNLDIGFPSPDSGSPQNLCFDGVNPVTLVRFHQQDLPVVLDTGAELTELWPPFANRFSDVLSASGRSGSTFERGFGGRTHIANKTLPDLNLRIGGFDAHLRTAQVLLSPTTPDSQRYFARLGFDVLSSAHQVTIDFADLELSVE